MATQSTNEVLEIQDFKLVRQIQNTIIYCTIALLYDALEDKHSYSYNPYDTGTLFCVQ